MAIYSDLFEQLSLTDHEFAQVIGHEIAHALANHTAEKMSRSMAKNLDIALRQAAYDSSDRINGINAAAYLAVSLPNSKEA